MSRRSKRWETSAQRDARIARMLVEKAKLVRETPETPVSRYIRERMAEEAEDPILAAVRAEAREEET